MFCVMKISLSKFKAVRRLRFPVVASPPVEKTCSTGAVEAGVESRSNARLERRGYIDLLSCQNTKGSSSSSNAPLS